MDRKDSVSDRVLSKVAQIAKSQGWEGKDISKGLPYESPLFLLSPLSFGRKRRMAKGFHGTRALSTAGHAVPERLGPWVRAVAPPYCAPSRAVVG